MEAINNIVSLSYNVDVMEMPKVYIVIGISCSGKSSFVRNTFLRGRIPEEKRDLMVYSELDDCILIGRYGTGEKRRDGTDSLERKQIGMLAEQVIRLSCFGKPIVMEGVRCITRPMMNALLAKGYSPTLVWLDIPVDLSVERWVQWSGKEPKEKSIRSDHTRCVNFINDYDGKVQIVTIDTSEVKDFSDFGMNNLCGATITKTSNKGATHEIHEEGKRSDI